VTDRETTLIVADGPSDRTAIAGAALRSRKRHSTRRKLVRRRFPVSAVMFVDAALPHPGFSWRESVPTGLAEQIGSGVDEPLWPRP
jgi:hypothetical protein